MGRVMCLIALVVAAASGLFAQDLTGTWQGAVHNPDTNQVLRTVIKIASSEGNPIKANFYSIDQTYLLFPATLTIQNSVVKMNIPGIGAVYDAKLSADGNTMTGSVKGFSVPAPWTLTRVSDDQAWAIPQPPVPARPMAADADPVFEVATIKLTPPDSRVAGIRIQGETISVLNRTLVDLVTFVYDVHPHQIIGLPAWASSERYDITGKAEGGGQPSQEQLKVMVRKLLSDRFQLAFHKDQRELAVYSLGPARGGAKISKNDGKSQTSGVIFRGPGSVLLNNLSMDDFCKMLQSSVLDRPVVNQTNLPGKYDFSLVWMPAQAAGVVPNPNGLTPGGADPLPDVFTALQEQLGLKADAAKLRTEVLVIDKAEKASDN